MTRLEALRGLLEMETTPSWRDRLVAWIAVLWPRTLIDAD